MLVVVCTPRACWFKLYHEFNSVAILFFHYYGLFLDKHAGRLGHPETPMSRPVIRACFGSRLLPAVLAEEVLLLFLNISTPAQSASPSLVAPPSSKPYHQFLVTLEPGKIGLDWEKVHKELRLRRFAFAPHQMVVSAPPTQNAADLSQWLQGQHGVSRVELLPARQLQKKWLPNDPSLGQQWHLLNTGQNGGTAGVDLRLTNVWERYRGTGVKVAIVDDGVELTHRDLQDNAAPSLSYDYLDDDADAGPTLFSDTHGTQVAGVAAARGNNSLGVCGVAPLATLASLRLISGPTTDAQEAAALSHALDQIHILNCSWGAPDGTGQLSGPSPLTRAALRHGAETGRAGRGTIYVFSAGNGAQYGEDANLDGYVNSIYTLAVGAVDDRGQPAPYSEGGACVHVVAPAGAPLRQKITTTDLSGLEGEDPGDYTTEFTGTSAAAPAVAGVVALMLEANPSLGWRDVQEILLRSARPLDQATGEWTTNAAGFRFHPRCGAGLVQADAAVALAQTWIPLPPQTHWVMDSAGQPLAIPDHQPAGLTLAFAVPSLPLRVEHAVVTLTIDHPDASQLDVTLVSPAGTDSLLLPARTLSPTATITNGSFSSVHYWGELATGTWRLVVRDRQFLDTGTLLQARLVLYGALLPPPTPTLTHPHTLAISVPLFTGVSPTLEVSMNLASWADAPWSALSNRQAIYEASLLETPQRFYRLRWTQP